MQSGIKQNVESYSELISLAARKSGRTRADVVLLAATKTRSAEEIHDAIAAGIDAAGENRVKELREKDALGAYGDAPLHFIGSLQSHNARYLVGRTALIHSVDSIGLAQCIAQLAEKRGVVCDVLCEVNIGREPGKSGVMPEEAPELAEKLFAMTGLRLRGLMCIPPANEPENARRYFAATRALLEQTAKGAPEYFRELSMGMTHDCGEAVEEGATIVRVGTGIFGPRAYPV